ncbi:SCP-domain-containing protein [Basidiobolus meristosporus CBS 931.73]|uniref:SCP-domain-containing protein n=1 Tax=Basidiobolus meristosporus CBS 931.73 TaxID=1314790 RepID=A0A1Y1YAV0_9FUNG|nr:SCP-domain-containing protein [Basidiobolus meristosporus CBS 931.73]|eukprot:ORX95119.1 SCP-domain-containing protein [Basidiobolus meristosporus CBS 931.73]
MKSWSTLICLTLFVLQAMLIFAAPISLPQSPAQTGAGNGDVKAMLRLVNKQRRLNGQAPLRLDNRLIRAAQKHTDYQARVDQMTHDEPGRPMSSRVSETGFKWSAVGENVAKGYGSIEAVMVGWMNSPGHRSNILNPSYTHLGSGYSANGNYWTQNFARKA